jgi:hypothetical protein
MREENINKILTQWTSRERFPTTKFSLPASKTPATGSTTGAANGSTLPMIFARGRWWLNGPRKFPIVTGRHQNTLVLFKPFNMTRASLIGPFGMHLPAFLQLRAAMELPGFGGLKRLVMKASQRPCQNGPNGPNAQEYTAREATWPCLRERKCIPALQSASSHVMAFLIVVERSYCALSTSHMGRHP